MSMDIKEWKRGLERKAGEKWILNGEIRIWDGKREWKCQHNRKKQRCKECGGSSICEHGKRKDTCRDCEGSGICEHNRVKNRCKDCGGSQICEHNRVKNKCKDCGGSQICEHGRQKDGCKDCGGSRFCQHGKRKSRCKDCGGSELCVHGVSKEGCKPCGGSRICVHGKRKYGCKDCGGKGICVHGINRQSCKACGGSQVCEHGKLRSNCVNCEGVALCRICKVTFGNQKYDKLCLRCAIYQGHEVKRNYKTKETSMVEFITKNTDVDWTHDKVYEFGCSKKRPDLVCDVGSHVVVIECDENNHQHNNYSCENKRLMEISQDFSENNVHRPIVFIRFNPDKYIDKDGNVVPSCWKVGNDGILKIQDQNVWNKRLLTLLDVTEIYLTQIPKKEITVKYLFYDKIDQTEK